MRLLREGDVALFSEWERTRPYPWSDSNFRETLSSNTTKTFVFEERGRPVGFAVIQLIGDEAYLQNIMVCALDRRKGYGEKIFQKVMMWAKEQHAKELILDVESTNAPAIQLYHKMGLRLLSRRAKSYPKGEDALIMGMSL